MPILLPNVLMDISRARYNKNTGVTGSPQPSMYAVPGNLSSMMTSDYAALAGAPEPALRASYIILVETGTDIVDGDFISMIYQVDGKTPWPGFGPPLGAPGYGGISWWVRFHREESPMILPYRALYVERIVTQGPSY
ncbi:MAG: hypothetical protein ACXWQ5_00235 [Ktedonobacterales bacterium]